MPKSAQSASFTFYPTRFLNDPKVASMTFAELGEYFTSVCDAVVEGDDKRLDSLRRDWIGPVSRPQVR